MNVGEIVNVHEHDHPFCDACISSANARQDIIAALQSNVNKLEAFKAWVHSYLDMKGIPTNPDGPHSREGCRIGDRMDLVFELVGVSQKLIDRVATLEEIVRVCSRLIEDVLDWAPEDSDQWEADLKAYASFKAAEGDSK